MKTLRLCEARPSGALRLALRERRPGGFPRWAGEGSREGQGRTRATPVPARPHLYWGPPGERGPPIWGDYYLRLREAEAAGQLLPLGAHHVVVLLEGALQAQQLRGREGRADPLGLAREGAVQKQPVLGHIAGCPRRRRHTRGYRQREGAP